MVVNVYWYTLGEWCEGSDLLELKCVNWNAVFEASSDCYWIVKLSSRTHQQKLKLSEDILCEKDLEVIHFVKSIQDWMHRCIELTSFTYYPRLLSLTSLNLSTQKKCFLKISFHQFVQWIESKIRMGSLDKKVFLDSTSLILRTETRAQRVGSLWKSNYPAVINLCLAESLSQFYLDI